jgi:hypothetical protein
LMAGYKMRRKYFHLLENSIAAVGREKTEN